MDIVDNTQSNMTDSALLLFYSCVGATITGCASVEFGPTAVKYSLVGNAIIIVAGLIKTANVLKASEKSGLVDHVSERFCLGLFGAGLGGMVGIGLAVVVAPEAVLIDHANPPENSSVIESPIRSAQIARNGNSVIVMIPAKANSTLTLS
jgi:hypothetical protein